MESNRGVVAQKQKKCRWLGYLTVTDSGLPDDLTATKYSGPPDYMTATKYSGLRDILLATRAWIRSSECSRASYVSITTYTTPTTPYVQPWCKTDPVQCRLQCLKFHGTSSNFPGFTPIIVPPCFWPACCNLISRNLNNRRNQLTAPNCPNRIPDNFDKPFRS